MKRKAKILRKTKETSIAVAVNLDGKGKYNIKTGIGFLDHMLEVKAKYGKDYPTFTLNILRFPSFQSPLVLPEEIRTERKEDLQRWLDRNRESELLHQMEITSSYIRRRYLSPTEEKT